VKLIWGCILLFLSVFARSENFYIATGEFPPFCSKSNISYGFVSHVVREAFAREGHLAQFDFLPWKRAYEMTKSGGYHASSWWAFNDERARDFHYSDPVIESQLHFFYVKENLPEFDWGSVNDLTGYKLGLTRGYYTTDEIEAAKESGKLEILSVNDDEQNFRLLLSGRIDLVPINVITGLELLRKKFPKEVVSKIAYHPEPVSSRPGFIIFPKRSERSKELVAIFNAGLNSLREDGTYDRMFQKLISGYYSR